MSYVPTYNLYKGGKVTTNTRHDAIFVTDIKSYTCACDDGDVHSIYHINSIHHILQWIIIIRRN